MIYLEEYISYNWIYVIYQHIYYIPTRVNVYLTYYIPARVHIHIWVHIIYLQEYILHNWIYFIYQHAYYIPTRIHIYLSTYYIPAGVYIIYLSTWECLCCVMINMLDWWLYMRSLTVILVRILSVCLIWDKWNIYSWCCHFIFQQIKLQLHNYVQIWTNSPGNEINPSYCPPTLSDGLNSTTTVLQTGSLAQWVECLLMTSVQSQVVSYQRL